MEKLHLTILLAELVISAWCNTLTTEPATVTKTFVPSQMLFANPERGWSVQRYSHDMWGMDILRNSTEKVSLVHINIDLSGYVNSAHIGQAKLKEVRTALNSCRTRGLKVILRSAYAWTETLAPDPKDIQIIKAHVMDMQPIYNDYEDVIIAVEMGMFGPWGEMHSSHHSTINTQMYYPIAISALKQVHSTYMSALSTRRSVLVRRPYYIRQIFNDSKPLMPNEAYGSSTKARTGYHNDAYLNSKDDGGTFSHGWSRDQELAYIHNMTRYTFFGGEAYGTPNGEYNNGNNAMVESKQQHMTYLHRDYYKPIFDAWSNSIREDFTRKLGYRFELKSLSYSKEVAPGGIFNFILKVQNSGFAAMHLTRPVNLILDNGKTGSQNIRYQTTLSIDVRTWTPEAGVVTIDRKLRIPATINQGLWQLLLALPDSSAQLQDDERYAVRFGNDNVWNADGTNLLVKDISITASAPGSHTNDDIFQEITITSTTTPTTSISQISAVKIPNSLILSATYDLVYSYHQVFIDADNNTATGYFVKSIGADFLVENSRYYDHKGNTGSDWLWQQINGTVTSSINDHQYVWQLPLASLKLSITSSSKIVFAGSKDDKENYSAVISVTINNS
ncbi:unnamed protein product [Rotaria sp. Silwood2]|nr:unnamed protein product [Rotaria sp. Silwood2]